MNTQDTLDKFELLVDDASELSSQEELDLANDIYGNICDDRDWEWLKKTATDTTSTSVPYIALPSDFKKFVPNKDGRTVVFVGDTYDEYLVIPFSSRRDHRDQSGFCYVDMVNMRLYFTLQPTEAKAIEYDYIMIAPDLDTVSSDPLFRDGFRPIISYGMAMMFPSIEQSNKLTSYESDYDKFYKETLTDMAYEDSVLKLSI